IKSQIGKTHRVIPEQVKDGYLQGHTRDYILVKMKPDSNLIGSEIQVKISEYNGSECFGDIVFKG
ncbi:MAG: hypothetical protein KAH13_05370, partial [Tenericutes bacterium]|nr:hypothetical protein [Mycoplasmatota bacterium]